jgi:D-methionine transport system permease protein
MSLEPLIKATFETIYMISLSGFLAGLMGIPLGFALYIYGPKTVHRRLAVYHSLALVVNAARSIPFIILLVALIPLTRIVVGTSIGTTAALVPLTLAAVPFLARLVEAVLLEIPSGLIEAAEAMGATRAQLICRVLWPEALGGIINATTVTVVNLVGYSAMAGAIGGGGLGDLAIRFGYQRFDVAVMLITVVVLIVLVQGIQTLGEYVARSVTVGR